LDLSFAHLDAAAKEQERIDRALSLSRTGSLADMVRNYFSEFPTSDSIEQGEGKTLLCAETTAQYWLLLIAQAMPLVDLASRGHSVFLEVGCGTAGLTRALGRDFATVVAMDADIDRMMLAQKACEEAGVKNALLVCAYGEQMPFAPGTFDLISAVEVLEHVTSQEQFLMSIHTALRPGGYLFLTTPNRFSVGLEPHVALWGVGFLPRRWMNSYVQFRIGLPYEGKRNLSFWELKRLLKRSFGQNVSFYAAHFQSRSRIARIFHRLLQVPVLGSALHLIDTVHIVAAWKATGA